MSGFFKDNPPATQVGSEDATESTIAEDAVTQTDTSGGFYQGSPDQTTTDAYTADALSSKNAAEAAKVAAEAAQSASETAKAAAETAETNAETAETNSQSSASSSAASAATSTSKAAEASASESTSTTKAAESAASSASASISESNAATSATSAANSSSLANTKAVEGATSAANSLTSENASAASAASSLTAKNASEVAKVAAETAESNAASSATSASGSASTATTQAGISTTKASEASASAATATTKAAEATSARDDITGLTTATGAAGSSASYNSSTGVLTVPRGDTGATGATGQQGQQGIQGETGAASTVAGPQGIQGQTGATGATGPAGADSTVAGPQGPAGADSTVAGPTGATGPAGADSTVAGPTGPTGPAGADSTVAGPQGPAGANGSPDTAAQVLAKIITVDGTGSGLDADLLDGQHASAFATLSGSNSFANSYNEFGNSTGSVSNDGSWNARVNVAGSSHARLDVKSVSDGIVTSMYSHTGHGAGKVGTYSNHPLHFLINGTAKAVLSTTGSLSTTPQGTLWGSSNDGSGSGLDADLLDGQQGSYYNQSQFTGSAFTSRNSGNAIAIDSVTTNMVGYVNSSTAAGYADGAGFSAAYSSSWVGQLFVDFRTGKLSTRGKNSGTWQAHRFMWDNSNDGSGSGLDADLLDGQQGSYYLPTTGGTGNLELASASASSTGYSDAGLEIREGARGGSSGYSAPRIGMHWGGVVASNISIDSAGAILIRNNPGTAYENFRANNIYANGTNLVWHTGNDGSGSGLDADLLDGYQLSTARNAANTVPVRDGNGYANFGWINTTSGSTSTSGIDRVYSSYDGYLRYSASDNFVHRQGKSYHEFNTWLQGTSNHGIYTPNSGAGTHFYPSPDNAYGSWRTTGAKGGYAGICHASGGSVVDGMLDAGGNGGAWNPISGWHYYYHRGNDCLGVAGSTTSGSYGLYEQGGGIYSTGNIVAYSDRRVKENIRTIDNALETVEEMRGVYYNRIDDEEKKTVIGFIAQEVDEIEGAKPLVTYAEDVDQYGVSYGNTAALLVEAVKQLSQQVKDLQAEVKELKNA